MRITILNYKISFSFESEIIFPEIDDKFTFRSTVAHEILERLNPHHCEINYIVKEIIKTNDGEIWFLESF